MRDLTLSDTIRDGVAEKASPEIERELDLLYVDSVLGRTRT
jgi:hypothetical protein